MALLRKRQPQLQDRPPSPMSLLQRRSSHTSDAHSLRPDLLQDQPTFDDLPEPCMNMYQRQASSLLEVELDGQSVCAEPQSRQTSLSFIDAQAEAALVALRHQDRLTGQILLLQPTSPRLAQALRLGGFTGEIWSLTQDSSEVSVRYLDMMKVPLENTGRVAELPPLTRVIHYNWVDHVSGMNPLLSAYKSASGTTDELEEQHFDAIIASELVRYLPQSALPTAYTWLQSLLVPHGHLIVGEPTPPLSLNWIERQLAVHGFQLVRDGQTVLDGWPYIVGLFHLRNLAEVRRVGWLYPLDWNTLSTSAELSASLVESYRQAFGGPDWSEWARCSRPGCGRHYSRQDWDTRAPEYRCDCGEFPLQAFHSRESILQHMQSDLAMHALSCCYVHSVSASDRLKEMILSGSMLSGTETAESDPQPNYIDRLPKSIDSFTWGYFSSPERLLESLMIHSAQADDLASSGSAVHVEETSQHPPELRVALKRMQQWRIRHSDQNSIWSMHLGPHEDPVYNLTDGLQSIFYVSEFGVTSGLRNMSMTRTLFQRTLQFAEDHGADTVVLRTSRNSNGYRLLLGVGMEEIQTLVHTAPGDERTRGASGVPDDDPRVLLVGQVQELLQIFSTLSDQGLIAHIAHCLPRPFPTDRDR